MVGVGTRRSGSTVAEVLRALQASGEPRDPGVVVVPLAPDGSELGDGRRLTSRAARPWLGRPDVVLGHWGDGAAVQWVPAAERGARASAWRARQGRDCDVAGDFLLFHLPDGRRALVLQEPC